MGRQELKIKLLSEVELSITRVQKATNTVSSNAYKTTDTPKSGRNQCGRWHVVRDMINSDRVS